MGDSRALGTAVILQVSKAYPEVEGQLSLSAFACLTQLFALVWLRDQDLAREILRRAHQAFVQHAKFGRFRWVRLARWYNFNITAMLQRDLEQMAGFAWGELPDSEQDPQSSTC